VHPLRVESVSWIAERKDVLAATFFLLTLLSYAPYVRRPSVARYAVVAVMLALGLMSKTMLVTLPCVLLLMDYWPLRRLRLEADGTTETGGGGEDVPEFPPRGVRWLVMEKLPLLALSVVSSAWTVVFQFEGGATWGHRDLTLGQRVANAVVSVPRYLGKIIRPADLSVFYPHPGTWAPWKVAAAGALVLALSVWAALLYRRRPYVTVGWFWFLGMLVPVAGIVQVGLQSMADRYTYLPSIGLTIAVVWWASDVLQRRRRLLPLAAAGTAAALIAMSVATWRLQKDWEDTLKLFQHALASDPDNWLAHNMVGSVYASNGERVFEQGNVALSRQFHELAAAHARRSLELKPNHYASLHNYASSLSRLGRLDEAIEAYRKSIEVYPEWGWSHLYLGVTLGQLDRTEEAMPYFEQAVRLLPGSAEAHFHYGEALLKLGRKDEARAQLSETLRINPGHAGAKYWLDRIDAPSAAPATVESTPS
jgi:protein O-mannosyl-transferase